MDEGLFARDEEWRDAIGALGPAGGGSEPDPAFRARLLDRTRARVRARRRMASLVRAAAAALLFAAGWTLGARGSAPVPSSPPVVGAPGAPESPLPAVRPARAFDLERVLASAEPAERRAALRSAGDAYLGGERVDPSTALLCYQELLADRPGEVSLEIESGDSWLLKALKVARR